MRRRPRTTALRLALVVAVAVAFGGPFSAVAVAQDSTDPWTVALDWDQIAVLVADVQRDSIPVGELEPQAVFGGEVAGDGGVTTEMTIGQKRYLFPGAAVTSGLAALLELDDLPDGVTIHSAGLENYFSTSSTTNVVVATVPRGTLDCGPNEYAELAVFELYPGTSTVAANPAIPNDPGVGASSAYSVVCADGETTPFFGIANKGALQQFAPGVGIVEVNLEDRDAYVFVSPRDVDLRVAQSAAADLTVPEVAVVTAPDGRYGPSEPVDPATVPTDPSEYEEGAQAFLIGLLEALSGGSTEAEPLGANPIEASDTPAGVPADDLTGVPTDDAAGDEAGGPVEVAVDLNSPDGEPADGFAWEYVLIGAVVILGVTFYYFRWTQKKKEDTTPAAPANLAYGPGDSHDPEKARAYMIAVAEGAAVAGADTDGTRVTVRPADFFRHDEHGRRVPGEIRRYVVDALGIDDSATATATAIEFGELIPNLSLPRPARDRDDITMEIDRETGEVFVTRHGPSSPEAVEPITIEDRGGFVN
ncbi:MAG: hypothetical protein R2707_17785 [Acidimicrobiales bacterium]